MQLNEALRTIDTDSREAWVVDLRDPETFCRYSFLIPVKEAVICIFDFLVEARRHRRNPKLSDLDDDSFMLLVRTLGLTATNHYSHCDGVREVRMSLEECFGEEIKAAYWLHKATKSQCESASRGIKMFLSSRYTGIYDVRIFGSIDFRNLTYFLMHEIAIITHLPSGWQMGISAANIFNCQEGYNFTFPKYGKVPFQRVTSVILSKSRNEILQAEREIEGIGTVWNDRTDYLSPDETYNYKDKNGGRKVVSLTEFIGRWENRI